MDPIRSGSSYEPDEDYEEQRSAGELPTHVQQQVMAFRASGMHADEIAEYLPFVNPNHIANFIATQEGAAARSNQQQASSSSSSYVPTYNFDPTLGSFPGMPGLSNSPYRSSSGSNRPSVSGPAFSSVNTPASQSSTRRSSGRSTRPEPQQAPNQPRNRIQAMNYLAARFGPPPQTLEEADGILNTLDQQHQAGSLDYEAYSQLSGALGEVAQGLRSAGPSRRSVPQPVSSVDQTPRASQRRMAAATQAVARGMSVTTASRRFGIRNEEDLRLLRATARLRDRQ
jgi:hypothetical protein